MFVSAVGSGGSRVTTSRRGSNNKAELQLGLKQQLQAVYEAYWTSTFCLQPPGDAISRKGVVDSILLGCIPGATSSKSSLPIARTTARAELQIKRPDSELDDELRQAARM